MFICLLIYTEISIYKRKHKFWKEILFAYKTKTERETLKYIRNVFLVFLYGPLSLCVEKYTQNKYFVYK